MFNFFKSSLEKQNIESEETRFLHVVKAWASIAGFEKTDSSDENLMIFFAVNLADRILDARFNDESRNVDIMSERQIVAIYCLLFRIARNTCFIMHIKNKKIVGNIIMNAAVRFGELINVGEDKLSIIASFYKEKVEIPLNTILIHEIDDITTQAVDDFERIFVHKDKQESETIEKFVNIMKVFEENDDLKKLNLIQDTYEK